MAVVLGLLCACGSDELDKEPEESLSPSDRKIEEYFKEKGCTYTGDFSTFEMIKILEATDHKLAYGSKTDKSEKESFWVAYFSQSGNMVWERLIVDKQYKSHAIFPNYLSNGNVVLSNVLKADDFDLHSGNPVIFDIKTGNYKTPICGDNYFFTDLFAYEDWFICDISSSDVSKNQRAKQWNMQISNEGEVLNQNKELNIPDKETNLFAYKWLDKDHYVAVTQKGIKKIAVDSVKNKSSWFCEYTCSGDIDKTDVYFDNSIAVVNYHLKNGTQETIEVALEDGKLMRSPPAPIREIIIGEVEKLEVGKVIQINVSFAPENYIEEKLVWSSSDTDIATVDQYGRVKGISTGMVTITVKTSSDGASASRMMYVNGRTDIVNIIFGSSVTNSINGYVTGNVTFHIWNGTDRNVTLSRVYVVESSQNRVIAEVDPSELPTVGVTSVSPSWDVSFNWVYKPVFRCEYLSGGRSYTVEKEL